MADHRVLDHLGLAAGDYDAAIRRYIPAYEDMIATTVSLVDGDVIDLGDRRLRVIHAPGHTRGSILLYDEDLRWLYTGDVLNDSPVFDEMTGADIPSYVESMRRMGDLDVAMVRPGHDNSFDGDRMRDLIDAYLTLRAPSGG